MDTKIFVCCHKEFPVLNSKNIIPIQGGRKISSIRLNMIGDDTGKNISEKNRSWCELTVLYWMRYNVTADAYGLFHYRRFLNLSWRHKRYFDPKDITELSKLSLTEKHINYLLSKYDIITSPTWDVHPCDLPLDTMSNYEFYCREHHKKDIDVLVDVIKEKYSEYFFPTIDVLTSKKCFFGNIFIMKKKYFIECMDWIFSVLKDVENVININDYSTYQTRVFGFLAERLMNVYVKYSLKKYGIQVKEFPVVYPKFIGYDFTEEKIIRNIEHNKNKKCLLSKEPIEIIYCCDNNYIKYCIVSIISLLNNIKREQNLNIYILNDGSISDVNKYNIIKNTKNFENCNIKLIEIDKKAFSDLPLNRDYISITTYFRLKIYDFLPTSIDKILYIDCDTIVTGDITKLWEIDLEGFMLGAADDEGGVSQVRRLGLPDTYRYFNAGVILFNLNKMRELNIYHNFLLTYYKNRHLITLQDQDILNISCVNDVKYIDLSWNANSRLYMFNELEHSYDDILAKNAALNPNIIHFTDRYKPWNNSCKHPLRTIYKFYENKIEWIDNNDKILYRVKNYLKNIFLRYKNSFM